MAILFLPPCSKHLESLISRTLGVFRIKTFGGFLQFGRSWDIKASLSAFLPRQLQSFLGWCLEVFVRRKPFSLGHVTNQLHVAHGRTRDTGYIIQQLWQRPWGYAPRAQLAMFYLTVTYIVYTVCLFVLPSCSVSHASHRTRASSLTSHLLANCRRKTYQKCQLMMSQCSKPSQPPLTLLLSHQYYQAMVSSQLTEGNQPLKSMFMIGLPSLQRVCCRLLACLPLSRNSLEHHPQNATQWEGTSDNLIIIKRNDEWGVYMYMYFSTGIEKPALKGHKLTLFQYAMLSLSIDSYNVN